MLHIRHLLRIVVRFVVLFGRKGVAGIALLLLRLKDDKSARFVVSVVVVVRRRVMGTEYVDVPQGTHVP